MAAEATLGILLTMQDSATPQLKTLSNTLEENRTSMRQLAMGVGYLGMSFMSMGVALKSTNSQIGQGIGQTMMFAGAIMMSISTTVQFVRAISQVITALKTMALWQGITKALSGPGGWITLGIGAGIAAGAVAGISKMATGERQSVTNINIHNAGSVVTTKQISDDVRRELVKTQQRNNTSGIR
jgi:hypothetical protein